MSRAWLISFTIALCACSRPPDFDAYCSKVAACGNKTMAACLSEARQNDSEQKRRGCGEEAAKMKECGAVHGRCVGGAFDPSEECDGPIQDFFRCLDRTQGR